MQCQSLKEVLALWQARLEVDRGLREYIERPFKLIVEQPNSEWLIDLGPPVSISPASRSADCTITVQEKDLLQVVNGEVNPQALFVQGKIRVAGSVDHALRLHRLMVCR